MWQLLWIGRHDINRSRKVAKFGNLDTNYFVIFQFQPFKDETF